MKEFGSFQVQIEQFQAGVAAMAEHCKRIKLNELLAARTAPHAPEKLYNQVHQEPTNDTVAQQPTAVDGPIPPGNAGATG